MLIPSSGRSTFWRRRNTKRAASNGGPNSYSYLRRHFGDEGAPVCVHSTCRIGDVLIRHPQSAALVGHCSGVVAPTRDASAAESEIAAEAFFRQIARTDNVNWTGAGDRVNGGVSSTGEEISSHN